MPCILYVFPLSCGILVEMLVTSIDTRIVFSRTLALSTKLTESVDCITLRDTTSVVVLIISLLDLKLPRSPKSVYGFS